MAGGPIPVPENVSDDVLRTARRIKAAVDGEQDVTLVEGDTVASATTISGPARTTGHDVLVLIRNTQHLRDFVDRLRKLQRRTTPEANELLARLEKRESESP